MQKLPKGFGRWIEKPRYPAGQTRNDGKGLGPSLEEEKGLFTNRRAGRHHPSG